MKILIAYYSLYGHVFRLAQEAAAALAGVPGAEQVLRRAQEFDVVEKAIEQKDYVRQVRDSQPVRDSQNGVPVLTLDDVKSADGYFFGSPTRFGNLAAQMKQVFDTMGRLWIQVAQSSSESRILLKASRTLRPAASSSPVKPIFSSFGFRRSESLKSL